MTEAVREIADDEFQRRVWLGAGPEVSSPDEAYNMLLDDFQFEAFLALADNGLSDTQREKGTALVASLKRYSPDGEALPSPIDMIDDPKWEEVRGVARDFLSIEHTT